MFPLAAIEAQREGEGTGEVIAGNARLSCPILHPLEAQADSLLPSVGGQPVDDSVYNLILIEPPPTKIRL